MKNMNETDPRLLALKIFNEIQNGTPIQTALDTAVVKSNMSQKNRALCTELIYGYTRYCIRINSILSNFLKNPTKLPKKMFLHMSFSAYEILFLDKIPEYASISYAVKNIRSLFGQKMAGISNAVLRKIAVSKSKIFHKNFYKNEADFFSVPLWMMDIFKKSAGLEGARKILLRSLCRPKSAIRLNALHPLFAVYKAAFDELENCERVGFSGYAFLQKKPDRIINVCLDELHEEGILSWQSAGSQEVLLQCFQNIPSLREKPFFDLCSGQGGKSFILLEQSIPVFLSSDISLQRLKHLKRSEKRLGVKVSNVLCQSAASALKGVFDANVILDVPCSGLGTLARRPEIRFRRQEKDFAEFVSIQMQLLVKTWRILCPTCHIVYITCTLNRDENNGVIQKFLNENCDAKLEFEWQTPTDHFWIEGMYVAVLKKIVL